MNTHKNNHESTTQASNPYLVDGSILPPPPPEWSMRQRTGKTWKIVIPVLIAVSILITSTFIYINRTGIRTASIGKAIPPQHTTTLPSATIQTPSYIAGLSSGDPRIFVESFSTALLYNDIANLSKHKNDQFLEVCQSSENPPQSETPACTYGWDDLAKQLANGSIQLIVDPTAQMTVRVTPADPAYGGTDTTGIITGSYISASNANLPLAYTGTAQFWFLEGKSGSGTTDYSWTFVYLWPTV